MSKRNLIILFLCIILGLYLIVAIGWSRFSARTQKIPGLENGMVKVIDPEGTGFVTPEEITDELFASLPDSLRKLTYEELDLSKLRLRQNPPAQNRESGQGRHTVRHSCPAAYPGRCR